MFTLELPNTEADMLIDTWLKNQVLLGDFDITREEEEVTYIKCRYAKECFTSSELAKIFIIIQKVLSTTSAPYIYTHENTTHYRYYIDGSVCLSADSTVIPFVWSEQLEQYAYYLMMKATS